jgi:hypothetical protein
LNILGALLVILNVATVLGPIAGVALVYQDNLQEMVIPPQLQEILNGDAGGTSEQNSLTILAGGDLQLPQFVSASADAASRSVTLVLNFSNPFNYDLNMNLISADIVCSEHGFTLGHASLVQPTVLKGMETTEMAIVCQWTIEAENHFLTSHTGESGVDVDVVGLTVDVNGITIQTSEPFHIPDLPISTEITPPTYISSEPDLAARSVRITFSFTNPFSYELNINSVSANIVCAAHGFQLGTASLAQPITIPGYGTSEFNILCQWTEDAETHFNEEHENASTIDVNVSGLTINVNNFTVTAPSSYYVPGVPLD